MSTVKVCLAGLLLAVLANAATASDDFVQWQGGNIQFLRGGDYKLGDEDRTLMTLEYANKFKYGDFFVFMDQTWQDNGSSTYYFEPVLRFSYSKISGDDISDGIIKDVLLSTSIEKPKGQQIRTLIGPAIDWNIPGFTFFQSNLFWRDNPYLESSTYQLTLVWRRPFDIGSTHWVTEGFADFAGSEGTTVAHELIVPRLLMDVGDVAGFTPGKLWAGVEWSYWHNKFGIDGVTESVPQLQVKWVF